MLQTSVSLKPYNTFAIPALAQHFASIDSVKTLQNIITSNAYCCDQILVLGGGSNVLLTQDYAGLVLKNNLLGIQLLRENAENVWLAVAAGENWHEFVLWTLAQGYQGLENLSLIPGTVGAAPIQNIGAYGVEVEQFIESVSAIDLQTGEMHSFSHADCQFAYRDSVFKQEWKGRLFITGVVFRLRKIPAFNTSYQALLDELNTRQVETLSAEAISQAVIAIRQRKLPDPTKIPNAGSFFKNPLLKDSEMSALKQKHPALPVYKQPSGLSKTSAAWLIEQCGFKGQRFNDVGVHSQQALVLVNYGGSGADLQALAQKIQTAVQQQFGIQLQTEVNII